MKENRIQFPYGEIPEEWYRSEIKQLIEMGYDIENGDVGYNVIELFEKIISEYVGSKYGIAISSATNGLFLTLLYLKNIGEIKDGDEITIPARTFVSVPMTIKNLGLNVKFRHIDWREEYQLKPTNVYDSATKLSEGMYRNDTHQVLSFQTRKRLSIGRGGMVITEDKNLADWLRMARRNGRHKNVNRWDDIYDIVGWDMYMTPDDAARGIILFNKISKVDVDLICQDNYPDLSEQEIFK